MYKSRLYLFAILFIASNIYCMQPNQAPQDPQASQAVVASSSPSTVQAAQLLEQLRTVLAANQRPPAAVGAGATGANTELDINTIVLLLQQMQAIQASVPSLANVVNLPSVTSVVPAIQPAANPAATATTNTNNTGLTLNQNLLGQIAQLRGLLQAQQSSQPVDPAHIMTTLGQLEEGLGQALNHNPVAINTLGTAIAGIRNPIYKIAAIVVIFGLVLIGDHWLSSHFSKS